MNKNTLLSISALALVSACTETSNEPAVEAPIVSEPSPDTAIKADVASETPAPNVNTSEVSDDPLLKRGRIVWFQCRSCHTLKEGEPHLTGPNLYKVFGRQAGEVEGFGFSDALANSNIIWSEETLDEWLQRPDDYIKGNVMAYAGLRRPSDREALMAYLVQETN